MYWCQELYDTRGHTLFSACSALWGVVLWKARRNVLGMPPYINVKSSLQACIKSIYLHRIGLHFYDLSLRNVFFVFLLHNT